MKPSVMCWMYWDLADRDRIHRANANTMAVTLPSVTHQPDEQFCFRFGAGLNAHELEFAAKYLQGRA